MGNPAVSALGVFDECVFPKTVFPTKWLQKKKSQDDDKPQRLLVKMEPLRLCIYRIILLMIMDYCGLLWIIVDYYGLFWIVRDYFGLL